MYRNNLSSGQSSFSAISGGDLTFKQQSILLQYQKIKLHETLQYSMETLVYNDLPSYFTQEIRTKFNKCVPLDKFTFYEMFTMLITEYLFKDFTKEKQDKITKLKALICSEDFLPGNLYTKGLLIKGIRLLEENKGCLHPAGQLLLHYDYICAFSECWKELISKICLENNMENMSEQQIDSSVFELFSNYFRVNFDVYWKQKTEKLWKENFKFDGTSSASQTLAIVVNPEYQISVSQRSIKMTQSRKSNISVKTSQVKPAWNYLILTNITPEAAPVVSRNEKVAYMPCAQEISRISEAEYSCGETEEFKMLLDDKMAMEATAKKTTKTRSLSGAFQKDVLVSLSSTACKANKLIEQMREYSQMLVRKRQEYESGLKESLK